MVHSCEAYFSNCSYMTNSGILAQAILAQAILAQARRAMARLRFLAAAALTAAGLSAVGGIEPGDASRLWPGAGPKPAVAICYELSDGAALAQAVAGGAEWLLTIANLDPYPELLQRQFLALAQLRSVETARPLLSAANTGPTGMVSAEGTVLQHLPLMQPGLMISALEPQQQLTPYVRWGERPLALLMVLLVISRLRLRGAGSGRPPAPALRRRTPPPGQG